MNADPAFPHPEHASRGMLSPETKMNLRHYWQIVLERRWLVIIGFALCVLASVIYLMKAPKIFRATAIIQIDREAEGAFNARDIMLYAGREQDYLQTQYRNLQSPTLLNRIFQELELGQLPEFQEARDPLAALKDLITVAPVRLTRLVEVRVEHADRKLATNIANTLATTFVSNNLDSRGGKALDSVRWMENEAREKEKEVKQADEALQKYKEKHVMASLDASQNVVLQAYVQAQSEYNRAQSESLAATQVMQEVARLLEQGTELDTIPEIAGNPAIRELKVQLAGQRATLEALLTRYKDKWPDVIRARDLIASLERSVQSEAQKIYESMRNQQQISRAKEARMLANLKEKEATVLEQNRLRIDYEVLQRKADQTKLLYNQLLARLQEQDLTSKNLANNMRVVDPATLPLKPVKPKPLLVVALGVIGGLGLGLGLAFFVAYLDDSVKTQDDIEGHLRLPFLGYIPNIRAANLAERDLHAHLQPRSAASEGFRSLRAALSLTPRGEKLRVVAFTSTVPSEGKSLCASNFAVVTAQSGHRTLLVDADLRRPSVHKSFQVHAPVGLADYLQSEVKNFDEIVHKTDVPGLDVICCGGIPANPSELIGSTRMQDFLAEIQKRYDRVILDCPPVSAVSDPLVISAKSDGVVFVTKFNKIRREHARRSVQRIQDAGIQILGVVINDIDFEGKDSYYYSYYYYQNQYYTSHYQSDSPNGKVAKGEPPVPAKRG
ncbi:MAG TPA: polysaccharide biosynthesis tyrosine autokinase [Verrucomicrobiota bacterium]|nr:polysaccharide biosynthesis tyrosine autokinase [Verrucomicrobiota bacterium]